MVKLGSIILFLLVSFGLQAQAPFITTWQTTTNGESITIQTTGTGYDYTVDWGDGTVESNFTGDANHSYATAGIYQVEITGDFPRINFRSNRNKQKILTIEQWGDILWTSMNAAFRGCVNLTYKATDVPNLTLVTDMSSMFEGASSFDGEIDNWDVSNVTSMKSMFASASAFNQDLNGWDVSKVTDMSGMFAGANSFNGKIGNWEVGSVTNMESMFTRALVFKQDISSWDVSNVADMFKMFQEASSFDGPIGRWDVSSVTNMGRMFNRASSFNQNLNDWDVSIVTNMFGMFESAISFNQDISNWDVSGVRSTGNMFSRATLFNSDLSDWDMSSNRFMDNMFIDASSFNQDLNDWNVSSVTTMSGMFTRALAFDQDLSDWEVSNVIQMDNILDDTGISKVNYDATLLGWSSLPSLQSNVNVGAAGISYCNETGRNKLINDFGWTFSGDTFDCSGVFAYEVPDLAVTCNKTTFNVPLTTTPNPISNIIGYDITVTYDPAYLTPTGNLTIPADLLNPSYVSTLLSDNNGEILISLALNGSAPVDAAWSGTGELFLLEFENTGGLSAGSTEITITRMEESYLAGTEEQQVSPGTITIEGDQLFEALLVEASSGSPIGNDVLTVISGTDTSCNELGTAVTNPAADGSFAIDVSLASTISIIRNVDNATDMMPVIGGDDALTLQKVLVNHPDIIAAPPTISQMMAMDVNMDGRVTSGDLTQVNQRTVGTLDEFRQAWNYDNAGVSNGTPSLDWGFVDELLFTEPAYTISSTFPDDDGIGYSKINVPVFELCQEIPISGDVSCPEIIDTQFAGVLLGDINGTVATKLGEGNFRTESAYQVVINLENAELTSEGNLAVPVVVIGEEVQNLDLNLRFDHEVLQYNQVGKLSHESLQYLDHLKTNRELRLTSYSLQTYSVEKPSFFLEFITSEESISFNSFLDVQAYVSGEKANVIIEGTAELDKLRPQLNDSFDNRVVIFPNPSTELMSINFQDDLKGEVIIQLFNAFGQEVLFKIEDKHSDSFGTTLDLATLKAGLYIVEISLGSQIARKRILRQ